MLTAEQIKFYEDRIAHLEDMLTKSMEMNKNLMEHLERSRYVTEYERKTYPNTPFQTPYWDTKKCSKCGISLTDVMCYTCNDHACPCGMGPVTCQT